MTQDGVVRVPYRDWLGVEGLAVSERGIRLHLPYRAQNSNMGGALHGGVSASLINLAAREAVLQTVPDVQAAQVQVVNQNVHYLAAAVQQAVVAEGRVVKTGKGIVFVDVHVLTTDEEPLAVGQVIVRIAQTAPHYAIDPVEVRPGEFVEGDNQSSAMGKLLTGSGFIGHLGIAIEHMAAGRAKLTLPYRDEIGDGKGQLHDGAVAALIDTAGAMAAWASLAAGAKRASTPAINVSFFASGGSDEALTALAQAQWERDEMFLSRVLVVGAETGRAVAEGTVCYRIVLS
ncbi:MAG: hotdog fold thioesterase [Pseudomonadota bacterium]|nr:hotdog fold thioesterase [Pseudomonadota bacterium]